MQREIILSSLTMEQVLQHYAPCTVRRGRCPCPLHGGKDNNFTLYKDSFYCWVCGAAGDLIKFVSLLKGITYRQAMEQLDRDFSLGAFKEYTPRQRRQVAQQAHNARLERRQRQEEKQRRFDLYRLYLSEWHRMTQYVRSYRPAPGDSPHPLFLIAIRSLPYIEHWLDCYRWEDDE